MKDPFGTFTNKHGVPCVLKDTGRFGHVVDGHFKTNLDVEVPNICLSCWNYDDGEFSEYYRLGPPCCEKHVWFPTKSGVCKKRDPIRRKDADGH